MKLIIGNMFLALALFVVLGCHDNPPAPDDEIFAYFTILATDENNHAINGVRVQIRKIGLVWYIGDTTNPWGLTHEYSFSGDTTTGVEVDTRKPGYIPRMDTFYLERTQPQLMHVILQEEPGCLEGIFTFLVRDTSDTPISDAELYATWYPGPGWNFTWSVITDSDSAGQIPNVEFIVDSARNEIIYGFTKSGYRQFIDTLSIETGEPREIFIALKKE
jgi:hypothetical protein